MRIMPLRICGLALFLLTSFGCSSRIPADNPEVRYLLASLTAKYLSFLTLDNTKELSSMLLWADYIENNPGTTKGSYFKMIHAISKNWRPDNSPISHLIISSIEVDEEEATVTMTRPQPKSDSTANKETEVEDLWVKYRWAGSGWLIIDDNIMGLDGLIAQSLQALHKPKQKS